MSEEHKKICRPSITASVLYEYKVKTDEQAEQSFKVIKHPYWFNNKNNNNNNNDNNNDDDNNNNNNNNNNASSVLKRSKKEKRLEDQEEKVLQGQYLRQTKEVRSDQCWA